MGKIISEMAIDGRTKYDLSMFNIDREALTNPDWKTERFMRSSKSKSTDSQNSKL